jgi:hypothetical protein
MGFPIRTSPDQSLFSDSPGLNAAGHVLHRLPAPRHPLYALSNLTIKFSQDKKCRYFNCQRTQTPIPDTGDRAMRKTPPPKGRRNRHTWLATAGPGRPPWPQGREKNGGADRNRTGDLRLAKPALSQLSYSPLSDANAAPGVSDGHRSVPWKRWWA